MAELHAGQQGMRERAGLHRVGRVGLIEDVETLRGVVVGGQRHLTLVGADRARHIILIAAIVVADQRMVPQQQPIDAMLDRAVDDIDRRRARDCPTGLP